MKNERSAHQLFIVMHARPLLFRFLLARPRSAEARVLFNVVFLANTTAADAERVVRATFTKVSDALYKNSCNKNDQSAISRKQKKVLITPIR